MVPKITCIQRTSLVSVSKLLEVLESINNTKGATLTQLIKHWRKCINMKDADEHQLVLQMHNVIYNCVKHGLVKHCNGYYTLAHKKTPDSKLDEQDSDDSDISVIDTGQVKKKSDDIIYENSDDCDQHEECCVNGCRHYEEELPCRKHYYQHSASYTNNRAKNSKCPYFYPHCIHSCLKRSMKHLKNKPVSRGLPKYTQPDPVMLACKAAVQKRRRPVKRKKNSRTNRRCCKRFKRCKSCGQMTIEDSQYESEQSIKDESDNNDNAKNNKKRSEYELRKRKQKVKTGKNKEKFKKQKKNPEGDNGSYFIGQPTTYQPIKKSPSPPPFADDKEVGVNGLEQKDSNHSNPPVFNCEEEEDNDKNEDGKEDNA